MNTRAWFTLHSVAGFYLGWLLLLVCLSGTLAVVSHEIEYLSAAKFRAGVSTHGNPAVVPAQHFEPKQTAPEQTAPTQTEAGLTQAQSRSLTNEAATSQRWLWLQQQLEQRYPGYRILAMELPDQPYLAGEVSLISAQQFLFVYFDPASGTLTGEGGWGRLSRYLRNLHMYLSMGDGGKLVVTALSFFLLALLISSFYVYRRWWRGVLRWPGPLTLHNRTQWSGWHKWLGACSWPFIALITLTGLWYFSEFWLLRLKVEHYPAPARLSQPATQSEQSKLLRMDELLAQAQQAAPWLEIRALNFPQQPLAPVMVSGQDGNPLYRNRANRLYLHPSTGELLAQQRQGELPLVATLVDIADPLHFGSFGPGTLAGLAVKLMYFLGGAALTFLVASGLWLHRQRTRRQQPALSRWLGWHGAICLTLVGGALWLTTANFAQRELDRQPLSPLLGRALTGAQASADGNSLTGSNAAAGFHAAGDSSGPPA